MTAADWPEVRRIYAEGIATGDATLEREAPDWDHFDRSHRPTAGSSRATRPGGRSSAGPRSARYSARRSTPASPGRASTSARMRAAGASADALLEALSRRRRPAGFWTLLAGVLAENGPASRSTNAVGFRRVGVQRRLGQDAPGRWRDVVLLERRSEIVGRD